jgi:hypothetical protein
MSYAGPLAILFLVLSPLAIPVAVTAVHAIDGWRRRLALLHGVVRARIRAGYQWDRSRMVRQPACAETGFER